VTVRTSFAVGLGLTLAAISACGSKGPPLPPLRPVPVAPTELAVRRAGERVTLRLVVPGANTDESAPLSIAGVEIYARTLPFGSEAPTAAQLLRKENLVHTIVVRPPAPNPDQEAAIPPPQVATPDPRPGPGDPTAWSETIPTSVPRPLELTREQQARVDARSPLWMPVRPTGLVVPVSRVTLPTRYYAAVAVSERGRPGAPSAIAAVVLGPSPEPPTSPALTYTESTMTLVWSTLKPGAPATVIESTNDGREQPMPVQDAPITTGSWSTPVVFGVERCFVVRRVLRRGVVSTESGPAGPTCVTPIDTFGPAAPKGLVSVSGPDGVTLVWDAVIAADLAGYLVLRGEGAGETLQQLTPKPISSLQFADATGQPGRRYVYVVVAVDTAGNRSPQSNRVAVDRLTTTGR